MLDIKKPPSDYPSLGGSSAISKLNSLLKNARFGKIHIT